MRVNGSPKWWTKKGMSKVLEALFLRKTHGPKTSFWRAILCPQKQLQTRKTPMLVVVVEGADEAGVHVWRRSGPLFFRKDNCRRRKFRLKQEKEFRLRTKNAFASENYFFSQLVQLGIIGGPHSVDMRESSTQNNCNRSCFPFLFYFTYQLTSSPLSGKAFSFSPFDSSCHDRGRCLTMIYSCARLCHTRNRTPLCFLPKLKGNTIHFGGWCF